nr:autotransporter outer membrane beta-barrel domain-containing protein [Candidatus Omnitrophota bacterium]
MKRIAFITIFWILLLTGNGFADLEAPQVFGKDLGVEIGLETSYITYKEPGVMKEKGFMYGITCAMGYRNYNYMLGIEARASLGSVDYSSGSSGTLNNIDDNMWEVRGLAGYDFYVSETLAITPYVGIGFRHLNDNMGGRSSTTGARGYDRNISYLYSPIGVDVTTTFENGWNVKLRLEYDKFWDGNVESHLGSIPGYYDIENDQDKGYGYRGSVMFKKKGETMDFIIEPFFRYWNIKDSKYTTDPGGTTWLEPKNNSKEFGISFAVEY